MAAPYQFTIEDESLRKALLQLKVLTGKSTSEILRQQGRLLAVNFAFETQPFGGSEGQKIGQAAVARDIRKVFGTLSDAYESIKEKDPALATVFYGLAQKGKRERAEKILASSKAKLRNVPIGSLEPRLHLGSLNRRGRVSRRVPATIVVPSKAVDSYIKTVQKRVGKAKAGWAAAADALGGTRGIPGFVSRQKNNGGALDASKLERGPFVEIFNRVSYIENVFPESQQRKAVAIQAEKMTASVQKALNQNVTAAGL